MEQDCPIPPQEFWVCDKCGHVKTKDQLSDEHGHEQYYRLILCKDCNEISSD